MTDNHTPTPSEDGIARSPGDRVDSSDAGERPGSADMAEAGGPKGLEPTRYGDWERNGRCIDF